MPRKEEKTTMANFLIKFHRMSGALELMGFTDTAKATEARFALDLKNTDPDVEIVVINSPSLQDMKISHSRYFAAEPRPFHGTEEIEADNAQHILDRAAKLTG